MQNLQMPHPRDWQGRQMPRSSHLRGGAFQKSENCTSVMKQVITYKKLILNASYSTAWNGHKNWAYNVSLSSRMIQTTHSSSILKEHRKLTWKRKALFLPIFALINTQTDDFFDKILGIGSFYRLASETVRFAILDVKLDSRLLYRYSMIIIYDVSALRCAVRWMQSEEAPRPSPTKKQKLRVQWKHAVPNTLR